MVFVVTHFETNQLARTQFAAKCIRALRRRPSFAKRVFDEPRPVQAGGQSTVAITVDRDRFDRVMQATFRAIFYHDRGRKLLDDLLVWSPAFHHADLRPDADEAALAVAGLDPHHLTPQSFKLGRIARYVARAAPYLLVLFPAAVLGVALHYPAYRAVGFVAMGIAKGGEDTLATTKVLAAMVLFPLTWLAGVAVVWLWLGMNATLPAAIVLPLTGYAALIFFERLDRVVGGARALGLFVFRRRAFLRLLEEQRAIREEILALGREMEAVSGKR